MEGNTYATWNGNNLALRGGESQNCTIELASDEGDDNADFWRVMAQASDNALAIDHYGSGSWEEKVRITSGGKFGVGTDNPGQLIHTHSGSSSGGLAIQSNGSTNYIAAIQSANNFITGSTAGGLAIRSGNGIDFSGNDGSSVQMRLASGNLTIGDGNLVIGTSGHGIDFSANTDAGGCLLYTSPSPRD